METYQYGHCCLCIGIPVIHIGCSRCSHSCASACVFEFSTFWCSSRSSWWSWTKFNQGRDAVATVSRRDGVNDTGHMKRHRLPHTYVPVHWTVAIPAETPHAHCRRRALLNIANVSHFNTREHAHTPLQRSAWLMALRTMTGVMSGMHSFTLARVCAECEGDKAYLMSAGLIHTHLPPDNWNHTTRLLTSSHHHAHTHSHFHTHTVLIRSLHYCWIMLFCAAATGISSWVEKELRALKYI